MDVVQIANGRFPQYLKLSSVDHFGARVAVSFKEAWDPSVVLVPGKPFPDGAYNEDTVVMDCNKQIFGLAERTVISTAGEILYHYKWADPHFLDLSLVGSAIPPGTVAATAENILCHEELRTPLIKKRQLASMNFLSLASTANGDGDMFYAPTEGDVKNSDERIVVVKEHQDHNLAGEAFPI